MVFFVVALFRSSALLKLENAHQDENERRAEALKRPTENDRQFHHQNDYDEVKLEKK